MGTLGTHEKFDIHQKISLLSQLGKELLSIYEKYRKKYITSDAVSTAESF